MKKCLCRKLIWHFKFTFYFHKTYLNSTIYYSKSLEVLKLYTENAEHLVLPEVLKLLTSPSTLDINLWTCLKSVTGDIKFWWNKGTFWIIFENKRKHARLEVSSLTCLKKTTNQFDYTNLIIHSYLIQKKLCIAVFWFTPIWRTENLLSMLLVLEIK